MNTTLNETLINVEAVEELAELDLYAEELPERLNNAAAPTAWSCLFSYSTATSSASSVSSFCCL